MRFHFQDLTSTKIQHNDVEYPSDATLASDESRIALGLSPNQLTDIGFNRLTCRQLKFAGCRSNCELQVVDALSVGRTLRIRLPSDAFPDDSPYPHIAGG
jgi:hypothetical protein